MTGPWWSRHASARWAWRAWRRGDVDECERLARTVPAPARDRLLFLTSFAKGRYERALDHYAALPRPPRALDEPVADAWLHLDRPDKAVEHLRRRGRPQDARARLQAHRPLQITLDTTTVVPFIDDELAPYLPGLAATLNGVATSVRVDTGGTFVVMGAGRAAEHRLTTVEGGHADHGLARTQVRHAIAEELRLGTAVLANVPVDVLPTLDGEQDFILIGTNLLQRFLTTLDHPSRRLILSPRRNEAEAAAHARLLSPADPITELPFYLWGDHYMFARGGFGPRRDLNFFIDTGLAYLTQDDGGPLRQAALWSTTTNYRSWGVPSTLARPPHFSSPLPLSLGELQRRDLLLAASSVRTMPWSSLGGVRIDGLLCLGFLGAYSWTLDFDRRRYVFR
ncbi:retropepsin-like aspartic protease [Spongiactinospora rosea]|uniref:retropepsin-like aspartic protease n=1 Tax=Spongiactinospora rosea TaxID=2248750 RepID=UPI0011C04F30|nr:retropepsin-like aspartic protease [Spongiactinospora rosea]